MIQAVDEALRNLLASELSVGGRGPQVHLGLPRTSDLPDGDVSLFLYDVRENTALREKGRHIERRVTDGDASLIRPPTFLDLRYLIAATATQPEVEHSLLSGALSALLRHGVLDIPAWLSADSPAAAVVQAQRFLRPFPLFVAEADGIPDPTRFWSNLGVAPRAWFALRVTATVEPHRPKEVPLVTTVAAGISGGTSAPRVLHKVSVAGTVTTGSVSPIPVAGARISLEGTPFRSHTDQQGFYYLLNLPAGGYTLRVSAEGHSAATTQIHVPRLADADHYLPVDVQLETAQLFGTIHVPGGRPAGGAVVAVADRRSTTDTEGYYWLNGLEPGDHALRVSRLGSAERTVPVTIHPVGRAVRADVVLDPVALSGEVTDSAGPVAGAQVSAGDLAVLTDAQGIFRFPALPEGRFLVRVQADGYLAAEESLRMGRQSATSAVGAVLRFRLERASSGEAPPTLESTGSRRARK